MSPWGHPCWPAARAPQWTARVARSARVPAEAHVRLEQSRLQTPGPEQRYLSGSSVGGCGQPPMAVRDGFSDLGAQVSGTEPARTAAEHLRSTKFTEDRPEEGAMATPALVPPPTPAKQSPLVPLRVNTQRRGNDRHSRGQQDTCR